MGKRNSNSERLAIEGGEPVRPTLLPYGHQHIDEEDVRAVVEALRSDWITGGPRVAEFEEAFAGQVGARYAVSFSSGTSALHGAAYAAGLGPGDEAITSPMTFVATANAAVYQGAKPVFADVRYDTLNIDPAEIEKHLSSRTRAIICVDYSGHPCDLREILQIAERRALIVIEDGCHALGAEYHSRRVGSIAPLTVFSFHPVKHITTGEGGMVTTDSPRMAGALRSFRNHGITSDGRQRQTSGLWFYEVTTLGFNYRLTDLACALGLSQLAKLSANIARRRHIAAIYSSRLRDLPLMLPFVDAQADPSWHLYPVRLQIENIKVGRDQVFRALRAENLGVNVHYIPIHLHAYYRETFGYQIGDFPVAERAYERLISLPLFHAMNDQDVDDVVTTVTKVLNRYS
jgi:perosamine synthetase